MEREVLYDYSWRSRALWEGLQKLSLCSEQKKKKKENTLLLAAVTEDTGCHVTRPGRLLRRYSILVFESALSFCTVYIISYKVKGRGKQVPGVQSFSMSVLFLCITCRWLYKNDCEGLRWGQRSSKKKKKGVERDPSFRGKLHPVNIYN